MDIIRRSFVLLPGVGQGLENRLWRAGITDWARFIEAPSIKGIGSDRKTRFDRELETASEMLSKFDSSYFYDKLPSSELWRLYSSFKRSAAFLDIETQDNGNMSMVGIFDGENYKAFISGMTLTEARLKNELAKYKMLVTFNGTCFDIPVIKSAFPSAIPQAPHVDVRFLARRLGFSGGLKSLERRFGIYRDKRIEIMTGRDAPHLWRVWKERSNGAALELLLAYNKYDVVGLRTIMDHLCIFMEERLLASAQSQEKLEAVKE